MSTLHCKYCDKDFPDISSGGKGYSMSLPWPGVPMVYACSECKDKPLDPKPQMLFRDALRLLIEHGMGRPTDDESRERALATAQNWYTLHDEELKPKHCTICGKAAGDYPLVECAACTQRRVDPELDKLISYVDVPADPTVKFLGGNHDKHHHPVPHRRQDLDPAP